MFPIIDISIALKNENSLEANDETLLPIANDVFQAFDQWGFIYLKGHGLSQTDVNRYFKTFLQFFELPLEAKKTLFMNTGDSEKVTGYSPFGNERFNALHHGDLKEALEYKPYMSELMQSELSSEIIQVFDGLFTKLTELAQLLLKLLSLALHLDDVNMLLDYHKHIGKVGNVSILRTLYYPEVDKCNIKNSQTRCGEHTDYGTITLLLQDASGGLEVQSPSGEFVPAIPIEDTIIVNAADLLERWTSGRIKSTRHRVVLPDDNKRRQSIAFFCQPDSEVFVKCLDGSDSYEPVKALDYIQKRFTEATAANKEM